MVLPGAPLYPRRLNNRPAFSLHLLSSNILSALSVSPLMLSASQPPFRTDLILTESQRGSVTCSGSPSRKGMGPV